MSENAAQPPQPILQIVHISDLHFAVEHCWPDWRKLTWRTIEALASMEFREFREIYEFIADGTAPHFPTALDRFSDFLSAVTHDDPVWSRFPTWLLDTGDLSTFGDADSLQLGKEYLAEQAAKVAELVTIPGNHDAWPGTLPWTGREVAKQRWEEELRPRFFPGPWPMGPFTADGSQPDRNVALLAIDTVTASEVWNTLASGRVERDQMARLPDLVGLGSSHGQMRSVRLLATHHPVHHPDQPIVGRGIWRVGKLAEALEGNPAMGPFAQLVLSGHTHQFFPEHGALAGTPQGFEHPPLGPEQLQFVVGSLSQMDKFARRGPYPYQCQVLRIYQDGADEAIVERLLAARPRGRGLADRMGYGGFRFVPPFEGNEVRLRFIPEPTASRP